MSTREVANNSDDKYGLPELPWSVLEVQYGKDGSLQVLVNRAKCDQECATKEALNFVDVYKAAEASVAHIEVGPKGAKLEEKSRGSGFVVDKEGGIMTDLHVVSGGGEEYARVNDPDYEISVRVDNTDYKAKLEAIWQDEDEALLRIVDTKDTFTPVPLAASGQLAKGEKVVGLGFPLDVPGVTMSPGTAEICQPLTMWDKASNPLKYSPYENPRRTVCSVNMFLPKGNSGGPLMNTKGELIGVMAKSDIYGELGFITPVDEIRRFLNAYRKILESTKGGGKG